MINTFGKILISAFVAIIIGVALIQSIGDSIELVKVGSQRIGSETLSFSDLTTIISNESQANTGNASLGATYTLNFDDLTILTEVRNSSADIRTTQCNVTLGNGIASCNATNSTNLFFDYTYTSGKTETLANDEVISIAWLRNTTVTGIDITGYCNATLSTGDLVCNNTYGSSGFANYTYIPDNYVRDSTSRTILTLTVLLFAIGILAVGIGMALKSFKEGDLL